jgi:hypothetical protein
MLDVDKDGWLMCAAVGDGDLMACIAEMTDSYRADKPGPTQEHDAHPIILSGTVARALEAGLATRQRSVP